MPTNQAAVGSLRWKKFPVLSDGFVTLVDVMGDDQSVVQAARVSYGNDNPKIECPKCGGSDYDASQPHSGIQLTCDGPCKGGGYVDKKGQPWKETSIKDDRTLIRYLMRHHHTTPFEMAEIKILVRVPMDCWRQWIRHRTACLSADTILSFDSPASVEKGGYSHFPRTVGAIYQMWSQGVAQTRNAARKGHFLERVDSQLNYSASELGSLVERDDVQIRDLIRRGVLKADRTVTPMKIKGQAWHDYALSTQSCTHIYSMKDRIEKMSLRMMNEATGKIEHTRIIDIWENGIKPVFRVEFTNGGVLTATGDHMCFTEGGWVKLQDALDQGLQFYSTGKFTGTEPVVIPFTLTEIDNEEWRPVVGYSDSYEVSNLGRIRSYRRAGRTDNRLSEEPELKHLTVSGGRLVVSLSEEGRTLVHLVQHLVIAAFTGSPPSVEKSCCLHLDGNAFNNRISNLSWGSQQDNADDRMLHGGNQRLTNVLVSVVSAEAVGSQMTYDIEVAGPYHNFIAGGVVVHNSANEYSTRYTEAIDSMDATPPDQWRLQSGSNKQGSGGFLIPLGNDTGIAENLTRLEGEFHGKAKELYKHRLNCGIAREQARKDLPLSTYTESYWKIDLKNLLGFLRLRMDGHAQKEIRDYATIIGEQIVKPLFPMVWEAFEDYQLNSMELTRLDIGVVQNIVGEVRGSGYKGEYLKASSPAFDINSVNWPEEWRGLTKCRERDECIAKLKKLGLIAD